MESQIVNICIFVYLILIVYIVLCELGCGNITLWQRHANIYLGGRADRFGTIKQRLREYLSKKPESLIIYFDDIKNKMPYMSQQATKQLKLNCHIGQRKLLLNELQFYSHFKKPNQLVIYIGSAPCEHLPAVLRYYPNTKFLLVDGNYHIIQTPYLYIYQNEEVINRDKLKYIEHMEFTEKKNAYLKLKNIKFLSGEAHNVLVPGKYCRDQELARFDLFKRMKESDHNVFVIQDYMTIELCEFLQKCGKEYSFDSVLFLSDIRSSSTSYDLNDEIFLFDNTLQALCLHYLQPDFAMLKYHPPFFANDFDKLRDNFTKYSDKYKEIFKRDILKDYENGEHWYSKAYNIFLQPWAPPGSSESRYIVAKKDIYTNVKIDHRDYEEKFTYLNIYRNYYYNDIFLKQGKKNKDYPYCGCYDCVLEQCILFPYSGAKGQINPKKFNVGATIKAYKEINEHLYYDLKRLNKKCRYHGWNTAKPKKIYAIVKDGKELWRIDIDSELPIESAKDAIITDTFDPKYSEPLYRSIKD